MSTISKPEQIYDVRLIERHLAAGKIKKAELDQYLKQLADVAENSEIISKEILFDHMPPESK